MRAESLKNTGNLSPPMMDRRRFLSWQARGLGATALIGLLGREGVLGRAVDGSPKSHANAIAHIAPRAKRAIHICMVGGLSHVDSFDYKPELARLDGKGLPGDAKPEVFFGNVGVLRKNYWPFRQRGQSGLWVSDLLPHTAGVADRLTVIRSMVSESSNHTPALFLANSGFALNGFPSMGSWLSYGLGSESESLPTFVVLLDQQGAPSGGSSNWQSGFLPAEHQGIDFRNGPAPMYDLFPPEGVSPGEDLATRAFIARMNERSVADEGGHDSALAARVKSYELAARMQLSVPRVSDLSSEPGHVTRMYGLEDEASRSTGERMLLARRLLERGVRFVQVFSGGPLGGDPRRSWDGHEDVVSNHNRQAAMMDRPTAGLIGDLEQRGMLEDTLVICTTEFGRTPFSQGDGTGRDHNHAGFTVWMAGAGLKPGVSYGATDEIGWRAADRPVHWYDFHATVLHLFGMDHERLVFRHNGVDRRLTNVHGDVLREILV